MKHSKVRQLRFVLSTVSKHTTSGFTFLASPKGRAIYTLTNVEKEPYIHSPITEIPTPAVLKILRSW